MYGGMFGDLPPTKEQQQKQQQTSTSIPPSNEVKECNSNPLEVKKNESQFSGATSQVLRTSVTTAVAFIPAAARRRNLKRPPPANSNISNKHNSRLSTAISTENTLKEVASTTLQISAWVSSYQPEIKQEQQEAESTEPAAIQRGAHSPHENANEEDDTTTAFTNSSTPSFLQHTHRVDRYDPQLPNDLLEYWERKTIEQTWRAHEAAAAQRRAQQEVEQIRPSSTSVEPAARGRGQRGISNLPAWMVEQQRREGTTLTKSTGISNDTSNNSI